MLQVIDKCEKVILDTAVPRYVYKCFDIIRNNNSIQLSGTRLVLEGSSILKHLEGCNKAVLLCATVSSSVDRLIKVTSLSDMTKSLIYDSMGSVLIEQVCNNVDDIIKKEFSNYYQTFRFSPGYGDLPVEIQKMFVKVMNATKLIGLTVTDSSMLIPTKSVTAIIGLSNLPVEKKRTGCVSCCLKETCEFRKRGERCEF